MDSKDIKLKILVSGKLLAFVFQTKDKIKLRKKLFKEIF